MTAPAPASGVLADKRGVALLEFAFSLPLVLFLSLYALEVTNLALTHMRVSQAALNLADNAGRVGLDSALAQQQLRESDLNDILAGTVTYGASFNLAERGRVTLSTLYHDGSAQRIHWQRCVGLKRGNDYASHYGVASVTDGSDNTTANNGKLAPLGMGPAGRVVHAPPRSAVAFVEINYEYDPIINMRWAAAAPRRIHYIASYIVRDNRDFRQIYNPDSSVRATCDKFTAEPPGRPGRN